MIAGLFFFLIIANITKIILKASEHFFLQSLLESLGLRTIHSTNESYLC